MRTYSYDELIDSDGLTAREWLEHFFEFQRCDNCGHDIEEHTAVPFLGNWFARCDKEQVN